MLRRKLLGGSMKKATKDTLVSIIVPVHNAEKYLDDCISSLTEQTYAHIEIILVDDGSTDDSKNICSKWAMKDKRIVTLSQHNRGVSTARNHGLSKIRGDYVAFVDADDWVDKDYINSLLTEIKKTKADICICGYNRISGAVSEEFQNATTKINARDFFLGILRIQTGFGVCYCKIYRSDIAKKIAFNEKLVVGEDALYNLEISESVSKIAVIKPALYNYRVNNNSVVHSYDSNYDRKYLHSMEAAKAIIERHYKNDDEVSDSFSSYIAFHAMLVAVNFCCNPKTQHKIRSLKLTMSKQLFRFGIKNSRYRFFPKTKQVVLFSLKHRLYALCALLCSYRQRQNRTQGGQ